MQRIRTAIASALVLCTSMVCAAPVTWNLTLTSGPTSYLGTFSIDDSLITPGGVVTASNFLSFDISIGGFNYTLANSFSPTTDGVLFDAGSSPTRFEDQSGNFVEFCSAACITYPALQFVDGTNNWSILNGGRESGTYTITRQVAIPLPPTSMLVALGLAAAVGTSRRKKTA